MKVVDLYTGEIIEQIGTDTEHIYYTTKENWKQYKEDLEKERLREASRFRKQHREYV